MLRRPRGFAPLETPTFGRPVRPASFRTAHGPSLLASPGQAHWPQWRYAPNAWCLGPHPSKLGIRSPAPGRGMLPRTPAFFGGSFAEQKLPTSGRALLMAWLRQDHPQSPPVVPFRQQVGSTALGFPSSHSPYRDLRSKVPEGSFCSVGCSAPNPSLTLGCFAAFVRSTDLFGSHPPFGLLRNFRGALPLWTPRDEGFGLASPDWPEATFVRLR